MKSRGLGDVYKRQTMHKAAPTSKNNPPKMSVVPELETPVPGGYKQGIQSKGTQDRWLGPRSISTLTFWLRHSWPVFPGQSQGLHWLFLGWERWRMSTFSNRLSVLWLDKYRSFTYMVMDWPASMNARNRITHSTRTDFLKSS